MGIRSKISFFRKVNWYKTVYFNFKKFPIATAYKLPVFFYGPVKFSNISGTAMIDAPVKRGMIGFGQRYEMSSIHKGIAEIRIEGRIVFEGDFQFGKDYFLYVGSEGIMKCGNMSGIGSNSTVVCTQEITLGSYARISSEARIIDTDFHVMLNSVTKERYPVYASVSIGSFNYVSARVTIAKGTRTPDYCTVASNSLCNKDYTALGNNILIGGYPAKLLKENITRDWETEIPLFEKWMKMG